MSSSRRTGKRCARFRWRFKENLRTRKPTNTMLIFLTSALGKPAQNSLKSISTRGSGSGFREHSRRALTPTKTETLQRGMRLSQKGLISRTANSSRTTAPQTMHRLPRPNPRKARTIRHKPHLRGTATTHQFPMNHIRFNRKENRKR